MIEDLIENLYERTARKNNYKAIAEDENKYAQTAEE
jgi:hypothetical protein